MKKKNTLDLNTVHECNRCLDCKTLHPQVSLINLENPCLEQDTVKFEFYAILLIEDCPDECSCCGRKYYDYSNATMVFLKPNEQGKDLTRQRLFAGVSSGLAVSDHIEEPHQ